MTITTVTMCTVEVENNPHHNCIMWPHGEGLLLVGSTMISSVLSLGELQ